MMISTIMPFGAINESEVRFIVERKNGKNYLIDNNGNKWKIQRDEFVYLQSKGYQVKEE